MTTRTAPPADRSFRRIAILFSIVFVAGALLMAPAWQALATPGTEVTALMSTCSAAPDALNVPGAARYTPSCPAPPDEAVSTVTTTYTTTTATSTSTTTTKTTSTVTTPKTTTTSKATTTAKATTPSKATTTSKATVPPVVTARPPTTAAQRTAIATTPARRTAGPIPGAVAAGTNEAASWQLPVGGALILLGTAGMTTAVLRRRSLSR
jgi:hypothetical protein